VEDSFTIQKSDKIFKPFRQDYEGRKEFSKMNNLPKWREI